MPLRTLSCVTSHPWNSLLFPFPRLSSQSRRSPGRRASPSRSPRSGTRSPCPRRWPRPARPRRLLRPARSPAAVPLRAAPAPWTLRRRGPGAAPTGNWPGASPLVRPRDLRSRDSGMGLSPAAERRGRLRLFRLRGSHLKLTSRTAGMGPNDNQLLLDMQLCPSVGPAGMGTHPTEQRLGNNLGRSPGTSLGGSPDTSWPSGPQKSPHVCFQGSFL